MIKLRQSGILRNPPIIAPLHDGTNRYVVLDGANRTTAISRMGIPHIVAQVVEPTSDSVDLRTWNHVLWDWDAQILLRAIDTIPGITMASVEDKEEGLRMLWNRLALVWMQTPDEHTYLASCDVNLDLVRRLQLLNQIVDVYKELAQFDRTKIRKISALQNAYPQLCALIVFPHFGIDEVAALTSGGHLFPAGITRFTVSPRALRINFPLKDLEEKQSLEEKNLDLQNWTQDLIARKGVRFYAEATVLFDE